MTKREIQRRLRELERAIIDGVSGMDLDDTIGSVKVWFDDGEVLYLSAVIDAANQLREELRRRST